jgi:prepilin signal peptidase PulO-like enzyme (type II secretory pathway)
MLTWLAALIGLIVGSFLNVVIHRLPQMMERQWTKDALNLLGKMLSQSARWFSICHSRVRVVRIAVI